MSFHCVVCNYYCIHRGDWRKHLATLKHKRLACDIEDECNDISNCKCECGRVFKYERNLFKHSKTCQTFINGSNNTLTEAVKTLVAENQKLSEQLKNFVPNNDNGCALTTRNDTNTATHANQIIGNNNTINNYVVNKPNYITAIKDSQINMKVYLDKHCSQAINLSSFIENLELNSSDLDETRERGLAYSLGKVLLRGLKDLDLNQRPIHCGDLRKSVMYVRDNDEWDLDKKETHLRNAINILSSKQIEQIKQWEKEHPGWDQTEQGTQAYAEIVRNLFKVSRENEKEKVENQVIKTIAKETLITDLSIEKV